MRLTILVPLVLVSCITAFAQEVELKTTYHRFEDHTIVETPNLEIVKDRITYRSLNISAAYGYPGQRAVKPSVIHFSVNSTSLRWLFLNETEIKILADGKRFPIKLTSRTANVLRGESRNPSHYVSESLIFNMPLKTFTEIVTAKTVEIQASIYELKLSPEQLAILRGLIQN